MRSIEGERRQRSAAMKKASELERQLGDLQSELERLRAERVPPEVDVAKAERDQERKAFETRLKSLEAKLAAADERAVAAERERDDSTITAGLRTALADEGLSAERIEDLVTLPRFRQPWRKGTDGFAPYDGDLARTEGESGKPMSYKTYANQFLQEHKHWLPPSNGGGAVGSAAGGMRGGIIRVTRDELREARDYERITQDAEKRGATIQVID